LLINFYDLENEVIIFLEIKEQNVAESKSIKWVQDMAIPVDNLKRPMWLEQSIKGKNKLVISMCDNFRTI
jgi:hypothetical protein